MGGRLGHGVRDHWTLGSQTGASAPVAGGRWRQSWALYWRLRCIMVARLVSPVVAARVHRWPFPSTRKDSAKQASLVVVGGHHSSPGGLAVIGDGRQVSCVTGLLLARASSCRPVTVPTISAARPSSCRSWPCAVTSQDAMIARVQGWGASTRSRRLSGNTPSGARPRQSQSVATRPRPRPPPGGPAGSEGRAMLGLGGALRRMWNPPMAMPDTVCA